eukprot:CAMPEP_0197466212 /NCGR_PEP_ID=MMETSP1175-20131217/64934_1 /TAXON_ID=1003142 /ORGANISM="Triceratium dubium, Strain CCMP147" /LENGTH=187 /DNA_ID=CAMNT_0043002243 /DNA_START=125 /DNA_END=691 /DNA_ORIENTATION=-
MNCGLLSCPISKDGQKKRAKNTKRNINTDPSKELNLELSGDFKSMDYDSSAPSPILDKQHQTEGEEHLNPTPTEKDFDNDTKNCPLAVLSLFTASSSSAQTLRELTEKMEEHLNPTPTEKDFDNDTKNCPLALLSLFTANSSSAQTLRELTEKIEQTGMRNLEEGASHGSAFNNNEIEQEGGIKPAD